MVLILLALGTEEDQEFPLTDGPVTRETRLVYAKAYLERKYELQGGDPADVNQEEIEVFLLELELMDIVSILCQILSWRTKNRPHLFDDIAITTSIRA